jgi:hypothetical protein
MLPERWGDNLGNRLNWDTLFAWVEIALIVGKS